MSASDVKDQYQQALSLSLGFLKFRFRSQFEIESYLGRKLPRLAPQDLDRVIAWLKKQGFVDDARFARHLIDSYLQKGKGPYYIELKLKQFGIDQNIIQQLTQQIGPERSVSSALSLLNKKEHLFNKLNYIQQRHKIYRYLYGRGYSSQIIRAAIDEFGSKAVK